MISRKAKENRRNSVNERGAKIHSYYTLPSHGSARPEIDSTKRGGHKKPRPSLRINGAGMARLAVALVALVVISFSVRLNSTPVIIVDTSPVLDRSEEYQQGIEQILGESILNKTKITFQREAFVDSVQNRYPEIESITVATPLFGARPVVHIREARIPFQLESNAITYAVSDSGVVVGPAEDFRIEKRPVSIRDESGIEIEKGARVLRSDDADFFTRVDQLLTAKGRVLMTIRITSVPREAYLVLKDVPYALRVYLDDNADTQIASYFSAEKTLKGRGEAPTLYMDLRAGEKIYWQ